MKRTYEEWLKYYENATKEDVIQDMMLDINSIKEKNKEIERLNNIINELEKELDLNLPFKVVGVRRLKNELQKLKGDSSNDK